MLSLTMASAPRSAMDRPNPVFAAGAWKVATALQLDPERSKMTTLSRSSPV